MSHLEVLSSQPLIIIIISRIKLTFLHGLIKHNPTHVLYVVELLTFKKLANIHDVLLFNPNEDNAILHQ